jgi:membrane associated rhomboid family serine protease
MFPIRDHNPSTRTPWVTWSLIALNVAIFLLYTAQITDARLIAALYGEYGLIPARVSAGEGYGTVFTSMFLHAGLLHIAGNMLFLWVFGDNMEDAFGHLGFLGFYLASGVAAAMAQYAMNPASTVPMVGASGAVAGVLGGYLLLYPRARVDVVVIIIILIRMIALPAWIVLGAWFALQIVGTAAAAGAGDEGGVAFAAHAGGFLAGIALTLPLWLWRGGPAFWRRTEGHPPHPETTVSRRLTPIPRVARPRRPGDDPPRPPNRRSPWG